MEVTLLGMVKVPLMPVPSNAEAPIEVTLLGMIRVPLMLVYLNAELPMTKLPSGGSSNLLMAVP